MFADMDEMMGMMFGGGMGGMMGGGGRGRRRRGKDVGHALPVTLEDLYNGKHQELQRTKTILCPKCNGSGSKVKGASSVCQQCNGRGMQVQVRQIGPGMMQQMQVPCSGCNGEGSAIKEKDKCQGCRGTRTAQEEAPLKVYVERGMEHEQQIPFEGEGDQHPDVEQPGSVVIVLQQLKHATFKREGMDLFMEKTITLAESLCGFMFTIKHLDGRTLVVRSQAGEYIKPGDQKCILNEGMPKHKGKDEFGNLIITFHVKFPERLSDDAVLKLREALPPPPALDTSYNAAEAEESYLHRQPLAETMAEMEKQDDDVDEEDGRGGGVQCASH